MANVKIPTPLRTLTNNETSVEITGDKVINIIENLNQKFPGVSEKIMENNELKHFVNIYINGEDIRYLDSLNTKVDLNDEIAIVPAVAGG
ncbi:MAG: molybdopterin synthase sulfur carrier subunit [Chloroflexi bacterium]|nr:molybdopterin synthase sulfur carrier subunit [Chloroflexota bacterium]MBK90637.1 molybdopterin synthase sulfur carrier subunit [Chloroflexota bacterium]|tara:strand:+ start:17980 stop:18249 length:270 start_codon:yes stop_codon:yes gene_type:complete